MPEKELERRYLASLRRCVEDIPAGDSEESETPDFLLGSRPGRVGIEFTEYHHPPEVGKRPHYELQSLSDRVIDLAEALHTARGGHALYVTAIFSDQGTLTKETAHPLATTLANLVSVHWLLRASHEPSIELDEQHLPPEIAHVSIQRSCDGVDSLWYASSGGWVSPILPTNIQWELTRKERSIARARARCDVLWLVIVHNLSRGAPCELSPEAASCVYSTSADRVLWLDPHSPRATRLSVQRATA